MDYSKFIRRRVRNLGISASHSRRMGSWFEYQVKNQGQERACSYFKRVGDAILNSLFGTPQRPAWVATKHRYPKQISFLRDYPKEVQIRLAKFARAIRFDKVLPSQVEKVVKGATDPYLGTEVGSALLSSLIQRGITTCSSLLFGKVVPQPKKPRHIARCRTRFLTSQEKGTTGQVGEPPILESLEIVMRVKELYSLPYWMESFYPLSPSYLDMYFETWQGTEGGICVGEIHASQEGGGKLRMYASPLSIIQCLLYPIHQWIDVRRKTVLTDCTYNQLAGALWAQEQLSLGKTVYSVDLSTATCRFPLEPQLEMLESIGLDPVFINAIRFVSRGEWAVGSELQPQFPDTIRWSVGQPLGIAPSMSMFSLAHNMLLRGICVAVAAPLDSFRVLGDDVVINNMKVFDLYVSVMEKAGVPISWNKSHQSALFAEFAGCAITPDLIMRPGQWREAGLNNHLSLALELRTPLYGEVPRRALMVEKLYLFGLGLYDPPSHEWSKYLRWNTNFVYREWGSISGALYEDSIRKLYRRLFNTEINGVYPEFVRSDLDLFDEVFHDLAAAMSEATEPKHPLLRRVEMCYNTSKLIYETSRDIFYAVFNGVSLLINGACDQYHIDMAHSIRRSLCNQVFGYEEKNPWSVSDFGLDLQLRKSIWGKAPP